MTLSTPENRREADERADWSSGRKRRRAILQEDIDALIAAPDAEEKRAIETAKPQSSETTDEEPQIAKLLRIVKASILQSFGDQYGTPWAEWQDGPFKRRAQIGSQPFMDWLHCTLPISAHRHIQAISDRLAAEARRAATNTLYIRYAPGEEGPYIQVDETRAVHLQNGKAELIPSPFIFRTFTHQLILPYDEKANEKDIDLLDKYLHLSEEQRDLIKSCLPALYTPGISRPIILMRGPPGSGKTLICRHIKALLDPSRSMRNGLPFPRDPRDFQATARQHAIAFYDNVSRLSSEEQDTLSRIVTGTGISQRKLYSDGELVEDELRLVPILNGVVLSGLQADFIDRSLPVQAERLPEDHRRSEETIEADFSRDAPRIVAASLKLLAKAIQIAPTLKVPGTLRLHDFARIAAAVHVARGGKGEDFYAAMQRIAASQADEAWQQSLIAEPLLRFLKARASQRWEGSTAQLLNELSSAEHGQIVGRGEWEHTEVKGTPKGWPGNPQAMRSALDRIAHLFPAMGIKMDREKGGKGGRNLTLEVVSGAV